jgi:hypothetical protein
MLPQKQGDEKLKVMGQRCGGKRSKDGLVTKKGHFLSPEVTKIVIFFPIFKGVGAQSEGFQGLARGLLWHDVCFIIK